MKATTARSIVISPWKAYKTNWSFIHNCRFRQVLLFRIASSRSIFINSSTPSFICPRKVVMDPLNILLIFLPPDKIIWNSLLNFQRINHSSRTSESMIPSQPRKTNISCPCSSGLLMDITFFSTESEKQRIKSLPSFFPLHEKSESMKRDFERIAMSICSSGWVFPCPEHLRPPLWFHVRASISL